MGNLTGGVPRRASAFADHQAADGIAGPEGADDAVIAGGKILVVQVKGNHGTGRSGIGVTVQDDRRLVEGGLASDQLGADHLVHVDIGLVQPPASDVGNGQTMAVDVRQHVLDGQGADFLENPTAVLMKQLVRAKGIHVVGSAEVAEVRTHVARKAGLGLHAEDIETVGAGAGVGPFHNGCRGHVAENEVAVPVAVVDLGRDQLRVDGQNATGRAGGYHFIGAMQPKGGRRAGHQHVEAEAVDAQRLLHFDGDGRVGALGVGARNDYRVDVGTGLAGCRHGLASGIDGDFGLIGEGLLGTLGD
ncbi:hypothetical protein DESC_590126 [Desulfosarcina cetonica]|nr:hypothetical protein DESC_590126 [Desulfosarcina cetonica]